MTLHVRPMTPTEPLPAPSETDAGLGALTTQRGNLPLEAIDVAASITGLVSRFELTQTFQNPHDVPLEATYIFPLPDRGAVTAMRMTAAGHTVQAELKERAQARREYEQATSAGQRASIAEQERADVFTMTVGNIMPGERVEVALTVVGPLGYEDGEATFRLPLVVAPRYIPGRPLPGDSVGPGYAPDSDAVPDASRITPPVLLPGFPNPVRLTIGVDIDPAGLPLGEIRSSLHEVTVEANHLSIRAGERADRDFILRIRYGEPGATTHALALSADQADGEAHGETDGDTGEGTFRLTVIPPDVDSAGGRPRDVVLVLDRSGSMGGWKMIAARRAAARIVDTLITADRFAVLTFDDTVERPPQLPEGLAEATDRNRFRAVEHLARVEARGGTELLAPLTQALRLLQASVEAGRDPDRDRDRVIVLVTDGQVGNEDQILARTGPTMAGIRVHTVGIDRAVNAGFLGRLAAAGSGRCELVESEDRLDEAMERIHRRIAAPIVTDIDVSLTGATMVPDTLAPARMLDLFAGAPLVLTGRYRGQPGSAVQATLTGRTATGEAWTQWVTATAVADPAQTAVWARAHLRDLEDRYASATGWNGGDAQPEKLERQIVATSLRYGVLCRFTAWLAVDSRVVNEGGEQHRIVQPVEPASGWEMLHPPPAAMPAFAPAASIMSRMMAPLATMEAAQSTDESHLPPVSGRRVRGGSRGRSRGGPVPFAPPELAEKISGAADEVALARRQAGDEARALRAASSGTEQERRTLLADLGSRLEALLRHLTERGVEGLGVDVGLLDGLRDLVAELAGDRPLRVSAETFAELWTRTLTALDQFAEPVAGAKPRREFWKRTP